MTAFGVSAGLAWSISATVPLTTGAAMLVPVSRRWTGSRCRRCPRSRGRDCRRAARRLAHRLDADAGRDDVRLRLSIAVGPRELNGARHRRRRGPPCPCGSRRRRSAPTARCRAVMPPYCGSPVVAPEVARRRRRRCRRRRRAWRRASAGSGLVRLVDAGGDRQVDDADVEASRLAMA